MKRLMGRLLAAVLTAIIIFSSAASGAAAQAQHAETGMSAGVLTVSAGSVQPDPETDESRAGGERPEKGAGRRDAERGAEEAAAEDEEENSSGEDADAVSRSDEGTAQEASTVTGEENGQEEPSVTGEESGQEEPSVTGEESGREEPYGTDEEDGQEEPSGTDEEDGQEGPSGTDEENGWTVPGEADDEGGQDVPSAPEVKEGRSDTGNTVEQAAEEAVIVRDIQMAAAEPDWTKGGAGTRTDVSDRITVTSKESHYYLYEKRGYGTWHTASYTALLGGSEVVGHTICLDPRCDGEVSDMAGTKVYEMTAPMIVKAFYFGAYGPGRSVVQGITGTDEVGANNIVTHVAAAEIYARLGYAYKSGIGDGFTETNAKLQEHVRKFVSAIEDKAVPDGYYAYVVEYSGGKQDFGFGSTELVEHEASFRIVKVPNEDDRNMLAKIAGNSNYSMSGARYGIYKENDTAENLRKRTPYKSLTVGSGGETDPCTVPPGTYYAVEIKAPPKGGYIMSNSVIPVTLSSGEKKKIEAPENYKFVYIRIKKEAGNTVPGQPVPSLAGAVFEIYSDAKRLPDSLVGTVTTGENGMTEQLKEDKNGNRLLAQTYYVREVTPPEGYSPVGNFSIDTAPALEADARYTLIDRTVREPLKRAGITIFKKSGVPEATDGNKCYPSLKGAEFGIYSDPACKQLVGTAVTDEDGMASSGTLPAADYWIKEIRAPEGYCINEEIFRISREEMASSIGQELTIADDYKRYPAQLSIVKRAAGGLRCNSLEGAEFTFSYYDGYYKSESELPEKPVRSWTVRTKENGGHYVARLYDCKENGTFVSGDEFYTDMKGKPAFPLGTVTISETRAPEGYKNDPDFGGGSKILIGNVVLDSNGDAKFTVVRGTQPAENTVTVEETPHMPSIRTSALDAQSRSHIAFAEEGSIRIIDTVTYEDLNKNTSYTMYGTLMDKSTGEPFKDEAGKEIKASAQFNTGGKMNGTVDVVFEFSGSEEHIKGHVLVVKEELRADASNEDADKIPGAVHWDPEDREQTIRFPEIGTYLKNKATGEQVVPADSDVEVVDTVSYKSLMPGEDYVVTGTLMDKATGKPLQYKGSNVTSTASFTAKESDGTVEVTYRFHTEGLSGKSIVAFERLASGGRIVAKHEDIDDSGQTVTIPGIRTDAYDEETGKKNTLAAGNRTIVDNVAYTGLVPGKTYEISGEIKVKPSDAGISFDDAQTVHAEIVTAKGDGSISFDSDKVTFVPAGNEGETISGILSIGFKLDASDLAGEVIVVGETLRQNGVEIAVHRDISDERQSDKIPDGQTLAIDTSTGIKNTLASDNRVLKDTFRYENLIPGETYRFTGKVMAGALTEADGDDPGSGGSGVERTDLLEEIPSVMTDENGIPVENGCVEFVPDKEDGTVDLYFSIDASELAGRDVTVFEKVTLGGKPVIVHEVLDGTQTVYIPEGKTTAVDSETKEQISMPDEEVRIIDTMVYRNLIPGEEYTVKGRVMRKNTGSEIASVLAEAAFAEGSAGTISVAENSAVFTPEQEDGALALTFDLDASGLAGEDIVMFERVYHNGAEVIVHENIDDTAQTIHFPNGHTFAADPDTRDRTMKAGQKVIVMDEFVYENLLPGKDYAITGKVMLKPLNGEEAKAIPAKMVDSAGDPIGEHVFSPESKDGSEKIRFEVDATGLESRCIVMFETLEYIDQALGIRTAVVVHEDINDEEETICFPDGGTTATDSETGSHAANADGSVTINDEVAYRNLIPGRMYTVTGTMMDKKTGRPVISNGKKVTVQKQFAPKTADGSITLSFTFNGEDLAGTSIVAFESVTSNGKEVFAHADLDDKEQTVSFPKVRTTATDKKDGDHEIACKGIVTVKDNVDYWNLTPGTKYRVSGILMNRSTGETARADGKEITGEAVFTAKQQNGTAKVSFAFDSSKLKEGDYVVFETLYEINAQTKDENIVGSHCDLKDTEQTVRRPSPPKPQGNPATGDDSDQAVWLAVLMAAMIGIAGAVCFGTKRSPVR